METNHYVNSSVYHYQCKVNMSYFLQNKNEALSHHLENRKLQGDQILKFSGKLDNTLLTKK